MNIKREEIMNRKDRERLLLIDADRRLQETTQELFMAKRKMEKMNMELAAKIDELNCSQAQVMQSEKLAAMGTLVAGVAHELNNPLTGCLNYIQYVSAHTADAKLKQYLHKAEKNVERATAIIRNMLTFSRRTANVLDMVAIVDVIRAVTELLAADFARRKIELRVDMPADLSPVQGRGRVRRLLHC